MHFAGAVLASDRPAQASRLLVVAAAASLSAAVGSASLLSLLPLEAVLTQAVVLCGELEGVQEWSLCVGRWWQADVPHLLLSLFPLLALVSAARVAAIPVLPVSRWLCCYGAVGAGQASLGPVPSWWTLCARSALLLLLLLVVLRLLPGSWWEALRHLAA